MSRASSSQCRGSGRRTAVRAGSVNNNCSWNTAGEAPACSPGSCRGASCDPSLRAHRSEGSLVVLRLPLPNTAPKSLLSLTIKAAHADMLTKINLSPWYIFPNRFWNFPGNFTGIFTTHFMVFSSQAFLCFEEQIKLLFFISLGLISRAECKAKAKKVLELSLSLPVPASPVPHHAQLGAAPVLCCGLMKQSRQ